MKWLEIEKKKDDMGFPLVGWMVLDVYQDEPRKNQLEELIDKLGEKSKEAFAKCLMG